MDGETADPAPMAARTVMLLGGYGNAGLHIARILLAETAVHLVVAGRSLESATRAADDLCGQFGAGRASAARVDAADPAALTRALLASRASLLVVAASTIAHSGGVAAATLEAGADYFDIQIASTTKHTTLERLRPRIEDSGRCFITDGGFRPGLPAAMVRHAAGHVSRLEEAQVGSVFQLDWSQRTFSDSSAEEFAEEMKSYSALVFRNREWQPARTGDMAEFDFGGSFGKHRCTPMYMAEFRELPQQLPFLRNAAFYSAGFGPIVDYVVIPLALLAVKILPDRATRLVGRLFKWGLTKHTRAPYGAVLQLEARGEAADVVTMTVSHQDAYELTAISAAASLLQYLDGTLATPGLRSQAVAVAPGRFFDDLARLGARVSIHHQPPPASQVTEGQP